MELNGTQHENIQCENLEQVNKTFMIAHSKVSTFEVDDSLVKFRNRRKFIFLRNRE